MREAYSKKKVGTSKRESAAPAASQNLEYFSDGSHDSEDSTVPGLTKNTHIFMQRDTWGPKEYHLNRYMLE